jgi:ribosomal protein S6--L-glutamate ligase
MEIAILGSPHSWYLRDLRRAAGNRHQITSLSFTRLGCGLNGGETSVFSAQEDLTRFDLLLVRSMPPGSLEQIVFRMDLLGQYHEHLGCVVNPPRTLEIAIDKYLALTRLRSADLCVPQTFVCQSAADANHGFRELGGDVVIKPLFGSEGQGVMRVSDPVLAERTFRVLEQLRTVIYLQRFIENEGADLRLFVLGNQVLGMRRHSAGDWRTNVSLGGRAEAFVVDESHRRLALRAATAVGGSMVAIDLLPGRDGVLYALEVNAVPGWRALAQTLGVDVSRLVVAHLETVAVEGVRPTVGR